MGKENEFADSSDGALTLPDAIDRLRLIDDDMLRTALQDQIELVQYILRIIMGMPDLRVIKMETQKDLHQPGSGRSLVLDVWAVDSDGTYYDIEIQRSSAGAEPHRARYHLGLMDTVYMRQGQGFGALPETKVIFITEADCIGNDRLMERFVFRNKEGRELKTGQEIIYLNTAFDGQVETGDEARAALAHDLTCVDPSDMRLQPLADRMRFLKDTKKGRKEMSSVVEQYAKQEAEAKAHAVLLDMARKIFETGKHTQEEISEMTELPIEEVNAVCKVTQK